MKQTLDQWLDWLHGVHPAAIDLGLERVSAVWRRLGARKPAPCVITVGGTNGKGSTVALLEGMLQAVGHRVGCYTSPHLQRYNERVRIAGVDVADAALVSAFERIEALRGDIALTWFEYGTLAALELLADAELDVALLEVGLGGRLDAVNMVDSDAAIVTSVGIDHVEYLGSDRDGIGREKAGIYRRDCPAIVGDLDPPPGLLAVARDAGARPLRAGVDFGIERGAEGYRWRGPGGGDAGAPAPTLGLGDIELGDIELGDIDLGAPGRQDNLASALAALHALRRRLGWDAEALARAARQVHPPARVQCVARAPDVIVDVAHNPQAAAALAGWLDANPVAGRTLAVYGAMRDKDIAGVAAEVAGHIAHWYACPLPHAGQRGLDSGDVCRRVQQAGEGIRTSAHPDVAAALGAARAAANPDDRILAFGSFHLAGAVLAAEAASATSRDAAFKRRSDVIMPLD